MSYGETALLLSLLGKDGVAPIDWIRILFGESHPVLNAFALLSLRPPSSTLQPRSVAMLKGLNVCKTNLLANDQKKNDFRITRAGDHLKLSTSRC